MNIFNLGRKYEELRKECDALRKRLDDIKEYEKYIIGVQSGQIAELEKSIVDMQAAHSADLKEIRELLEMPHRRKSTVRPWTMLRSVAEAGERFMKDKQGA